MTASSSRLGLLLWLLSVAFALRVVGQALQYWIPQTFLPTFGSFQGSNLPYGVLLPVQLVILGLMIKASWQVQHGKTIPSRRTGQMLVWSGSIYMAASVARVIIGLTMETASPWFRAWTPAVFHLVLSGFVLALSCYHRRGLHKHC